MSAKKIFWISFPFPPAVSAGVFRSVRFIKYLPDFDWQPIVFTVEPDPAMPTDPTLLELVPDGLEVHSRKMWRPDQWISKFVGSRKSKKAAAGPTAQQPKEAKQIAKKKGYIRNAISNLKERFLATPDQKIWWCRPAFSSAVRLLKQTNSEAIFSTAPPHSSHLLGVWLKRRTRLPLILDFRDPWSRSPWSKERSNYIDRIHQKMERQCVESADAIILNTENARQEFVDYYGPLHANKFHTINNGFDPDILQKIDDLRSQAVPNKGNFKICHVGTIYGRREIRPLLQAISAFNSKSQAKVCFEQIGHVKVDYDIREVVQNLGLENDVSLTPQVSHTEALKKMASSDAHLLLQPDGELQIPGKLFEMILFNKPVITLTGGGATRDLAAKHKLGPIADASNVDQIVTALHDLAVGTSAQETDWNFVLNAFNGRNQTKILAELFDAVLE